MTPWRLTPLGHEAIECSSSELLFVRSLIAGLLGDGSGNGDWKPREPWRGRFIFAIFLQRVNGRSYSFIAGEHYVILWP
mgnify:CR=1 FL=1